MSKTADSRTTGQELVASLRSGWRPTPMEPPFRVEPGEVCYSAHDVQVLQSLEGDGAWVKKRTYGIGLIPFAMMAGNAVGNSARKRAAARDAQAVFRPVDGGRLFVTSERLAIQGHQWIDVWYRNIRNSYCDEGAITLELSGSSPVQLRTWPAYWVFAMMRFVAWGEVVSL
jgi:hypothetical protein